MSTKYKFHNQEQLYFITFAVVNWIDLFIRNEYRRILLDNWQYCVKNKGLQVYGWCIMTSHVHMIIGIEKENLQDIVRDMKRHTSILLRNAIKQYPQESPPLPQASRLWPSDEGIIDVVINGMFNN